MQMLTIMRSRKDCVECSLLTVGSPTNPEEDLFFWWNLGPHACKAGPLLLDPLHYPFLCKVFFFFFFFFSEIGSPEIFAQAGLNLQSSAPQVARITGASQ
jgi:hypothetical protein